MFSQCLGLKIVYHSPIRSANIPESKLKGIDLALLSNELYGCRVRALTLPYYGLYGCQERKVVWKKKQPVDKEAKQDREGEDQRKKEDPKSDKADTRQVTAAQKEEQQYQADQEQEKGGNAWITPKRRGQKQIEATKNKEARKIGSSNNGYAVLQAASKPFFVTIVCGSNSMETRKGLWDSLDGFGKIIEPWIILGDFNSMFSFQDRHGGRPIQNKDVIDAQNWLAMGQVEELKCSGSFFTWTNKHEVGDRIFSKLDRVFINDIWMEDFPTTKACFKWEVISDHCLCLIRHFEHNNTRIKPFRYGNHWPSYPGYEKAVMGCWSKPATGFGLDGLVQKLFRIKHTLKAFYKSSVGDVMSTIWL
uniref:Endonuclease/exonuclease/phosphatase domain-containing protein n=1 Tax=Cannabis sativa TaxID=3483 RepID=A0A803QGT7_CANSA